MKKEIQLACFNRKDICVRKYHLNTYFGAKNLGVSSQPAAVSSLGHYHVKPFTTIPLDLSMSLFFTMDMTLFEFTCIIIDPKQISFFENEMLLTMTFNKKCCPKKTWCRVKFFTKKNIHPLSETN